MSIAKNSLTVNELLGALSVKNGIKCPGRLRPLRKLEQLCCPILKLDRTKDANNPTLRFFHRTAREFLLLDPDTIDKELERKERDFFVDATAANDLLGEVCLGYLMSEEYVAPDLVTLEAQLQSQDHAFLKYAAIFWHAHLSASPGTEELCNRVSAFMRSCNFLTCIWLQSKYAPYLFARLTDIGEHRYVMNTAKDIYCEDGRPFYSDALPGWLQDWPDGAKLVQSYTSFIKEYGPVLLRRPGDVTLVQPETLGDSRNFFSTKQLWAPRGNVFTALPHVPAIEKPPKRCILSLQLSSSGLLARWITFGVRDGSFTLNMVDGLVTVPFENFEVVKNFSFTVPVLQYVDSWTSSLVRSTSWSQATTPSPTRCTSRRLATFSHDGSLVSIGRDIPYLLRVSFGGEGVLALPCWTPDESSCFREIPGREDPKFRGMEHATHGPASVIAYRWSSHEIKKGTMTFDYGTDSSSRLGDDDGGEETDEDDDDSDDETDQGLSLDAQIAFSSLAVFTDSNQPRWFHFEELGVHLRNSPPVFHPTKPLLLWTPNESKLIVINYVSGRTSSVFRSQGKETMAVVARGMELYDGRCWF